MQTNQTICSQKFTSTSGTATVSALRVNNRIAVRVGWPAGYDNCPSVKWFDDDASAIAGYLIACQWLQNEYKFKTA